MQNALDWQKDMLEKCELTLKNTKTLRKDKRAPSSLINLLNNHDQQLDNYKIKENEIS